MRLRPNRPETGPGGACQLVALLLLLVASTQPAGAQDFRRAEYVELGGIDQWISIRGSSERNPIILIVHGGPGFSNAAHTSAFDSWQDDFTIVDWDQRGAGSPAFQHDSRKAMEGSEEAPGRGSPAHREVPRSSVQPSGAP